MDITTDNLHDGSHDRGSAMAIDADAVERSGRPGRASPPRWLTFR